MSHRAHHRDGARRAAPNAATTTSPRHGLSFSSRRHPSIQQARPRRPRRGSPRCVGDRIPARNNRWDITRATPRIPSKSDRVIAYKTRQVERAVSWPGHPRWADPRRRRLQRGGVTLNLNARLTSTARTIRAVWISGYFRSHYGITIVLILIKARAPQRFWQVRVSDLGSSSTSLGPHGDDVHHAAEWRHRAGRALARKATSRSSTTPSSQVRARPIRFSSPTRPPFTLNLGTPIARLQPNGTAARQPLRQSRRRATRPRSRCASPALDEYEDPWPL